jgi:WD40 repeat protein
MTSGQAVGMVTGRFAMAELIGELEQDITSIWDWSMIDVHPSDPLVFQLNTDYTSTVWDVDSLKCVARFGRSSELCNCQAMSSDGRYFALGDLFGYVYILHLDSIEGYESGGWQLHRGNFTVLRCENTAVDSLCFMADTSLLAVRQGYYFSTYDWASSGPKISIRAKVPGIYMALSPNGRTLCTPEGAVLRTRQSSSLRARNHVSFPAKVRALTYSPDGKHIFGGCEDGSMLAVAVGTNQVRRFGAHTARVTALRHYPDLPIVVTGRLHLE